MALKRGAWIAIAAVGVAAACGAGWWGWSAWRAQKVSYVTAPVSTGSVITGISASGGVNPVVTVQVGAFVSGNIQSLSCDFNTKVRKGQLCAALDPRPYQLIADQAQATLVTARAQRDKDQAALVYAAVNRRRLTGLLALDSASHDVVDVAVAAEDQDRAQVAFDVASIAQHQSALEAAKVNLSFTRIISPVDGTVVSRNVTVGQTVAASFTTPTLFLIAQDLTKMQVDTNVSESDVSGVRVGAGASFTVTAFPGRTFDGRVVQLRQAPISVQNVITYDVVISVDNADLSLMPGMTATARIMTARRDRVTRVPVQALRYAPAKPQADAATQNHGAPPKAGAQTLWGLRHNKPVATPVTVGLQDETHAEILSGDLHLGDRVILSERIGPKKARVRGAAPISLGH